MFKIKKGDTVKVIAGKDKDKEGKVISVNPKKGAVLVEGVNMVTKHTKPSMSNQHLVPALRLTDAGTVQQQEAQVLHIFYIISIALQQFRAGHPTLQKHRYASHREFPMLTYYQESN